MKARHDDLRRHGLRVTPQRTAILDAIRRAGRPLTARDVWERVRAAHPRMSLDTVYRNLVALAGLGVVGQIHLQNQEVARFEFQGPRSHHHHAVCLRCRKTFHIPACPRPLLRPPREDPGFRITSHAFEIYGYCGRCGEPA
ncbi:MAG: Fur family transcriptional regulator [Armatimonadota bacterium]|nr:Fur family transcriptional regulator [Armatimonadota bacterium]MDR5696329.1 Fur family transcriptional regulator [Armatimonadota bacterium]